MSSTQHQGEQMSTGQHQRPRGRVDRAQHLGEPSLQRVTVKIAAGDTLKMYGSFKTIDRFDWAHPEKIDRPLVELDFVDGGENVLLKVGQASERP